MDTAALNAFVAVAEQASFSLAADALHLTQPAVSKRIATLEDVLGVRLFDRIGRRVVLTEAGHTLLPRAHRVLAELADARRALANLGGQIAGSLTLATSHHIGLHRLPPVLRAFAQRHPDVQLDLRFTDSELACEAIARGDMELAVVTLPVVMPPGPLLFQPVWEDPLVPVVPVNHPLAGAHHPTAQALAREPAILPGTGTFTRGIVDRVFAEQGLKLRVAFETNYMETIKMMVSVGLGWSVIPATMVDADVVAVAVPALNAHRLLGVVRHTRHTLSNAAQAFLAVLTHDAATAEQAKNFVNTAT